MANVFQHIIYVTAVLCALECRLVVSCPGDLPWSDPCGGSNPIEGQGGVAANTTLSDALNEFVVSAKESEGFARTLRGKYANDSTVHIRVSKILAVMLTNVHCSPVPYMRNNSMALAEALQSDFQNIATIAIVMSIIHRNERTSGTTIRFTHEMDDFETSIYTSLCKLNIAAQIAGYSLNRCIERGVIPAQYMEINRTPVRYMRDFIVARDSEKYFNVFQRGYNYDHAVLT